MSGKKKKAVTWLLTAVTIMSPLAQSLTPAYSADEDTSGTYVADGGSVSGSDTVSGNTNSVSGGDVDGFLTVSGSDAQYVMDDYFTGETYVTIRGKETSQVTKMRTGDEVAMDLSWAIDADSFSSKGIAEFTYELPTGVTWAQSEGNIGSGSYRLADGTLSIFYDMAQEQGQVNARLYVTGNASTYALADAAGNIRLPDGSAYAPYDEEARLAGIAAEWAAKGLLPYENWVYGEAECNNNIPFDRGTMNYYSAEEASSLDTRLGKAQEGTYFLYTDNLADVIRMAEDGMDLDRFFYGNVLYGLSLNELYRMEDEGISLADAVDMVISSMPMAVYGDERAGGTMFVANMVKYTNSLGVIPQLGSSKSHGPMWQILTSQGQIARCLLYGGSLRKGDTFYEVPYMMVADLNGMPISQTKYNALMAVAEQNDCVGGSAFDIQISQIITWYILANNVDPNMNGEEMFHLVKMLYMKCFGVSAGEAAANPVLYGDNGILHAWVLGWVQRYRDNEGLTYDEAYAPTRRTVALTFWLSFAGGNKQPLMTWVSTERINLQNGTLYCTKIDEKGNPLAGCLFDIYDATMKYVGSFRSDGGTKKITLPAGYYWVKEVSAPEGYKVDPTNHAVTLTEGGNFEFYLNMVNEREKPSVELYKYDFGTSSPIRNLATLQVLKKSDRSVVAEVKVGIDGPVTISLDAGQYILHEKTVPTGYLRADDIEFTVPDRVPSTTSVIMYDKYTSVVIDKKDAETGGYAVGAELALFRANENFTITGNTPYARWTTDGTDKVFDRIPVGNYVLRELTAPAGYVRAADVNITVREVGEQQRFTIYNNKRSLSILKVDEKSGEPLSNVGLELWTLDAAKNRVSLIDAWTTDGTPHKIDGVNIGVAYGLVETSTPENYESFGMKEIVFGHQHDASCYRCNGTEFEQDHWTTYYHTDLGTPGTCVRCNGPIENCPGHTDNHYKSTCKKCGKEYENGNGFAQNPSTCTNISSTPMCGLQEGDIQNQVLKVTNKRISDVVTIEIDKIGPSLIDAYATCKVVGAEMELRSSNGTVVAAWTTDGKTKTIKNIAPGTYTLVETKAPDGYVKAADMTIVVKDSFTTQYYSMYDEDTELKVRKLDEEGQNVVGATLQIYHANADGSRGAKYGSSFVTGLDDYEVRGIPVGKYILVEEKAPEGYAIADPVPFEVINTGDVQTVTMVDKPLVLLIAKRNAPTPDNQWNSDLIEGAQLRLWTVNAAGQKDRIFASWTTDGSIYRIEKIPEGTYILEEVYAPSGYVKSEDIKVVVTGNNTNFISVTMYDKSTKVEIDKLNNVNASVSGAKMALVRIDDNGVVLGTYDTWTTDGTPHKLEYVPVGKYLLMELEAPTGYFVADPIAIEVKETGDVQKFTMTDEFHHIPFTLDKVDALTGERISGDAAFDLYEWNETAKEYRISSNFSITRKADGTYWVTSSYDWAGDGELYWMPENQGKFYYQEKQAPDGYVVDSTPVYINVLDSNILDEDGNYKAHNAAPEDFYINNSAVFANEKQYGEVDIHKYDNEAEADDADGNRVTQGDTTTLDGAVYGLYAAEDIMDDGKVLYTAGQIVRTATIGFSTVTDDKGNLLDEDGNWCALSGKDPALTVTPGKTNFQQVEIGKYYVAEITPAEGYQLDTDGHRGSEVKKYYVTFTNTNTPGQHVVLRDETAASAGNNLSMDDNLNTKDIYSGDYVMKQAAKFVKMEDLSTSTEMEPLEAGFTLYRLSDLSGVKSGIIAPKGDVWSKRDIQTLKYYDFSADQAATLYKRANDTWTDGDKAWLEATGVPNQYRVKEMWSDKEDGYFVTPELPYGQYVLIETSVPEGKDQADPIIITISKDSAIPQPTRYIGNETLECYLRLVKADAENGQTVLKEGAAYRIRLVSNVDGFDSTTWKLHEDGFIYYWDPMGRVEQGDAEHPFKVQNMYESGKIADSYIELPYMLPYGDYELIEVTAPKGYVISGSEQKVKDESSAGINRYEVVDTPVNAVQFSITNSVLLDDNAVVDKYDRVIVTVKQQNEQQKGILHVTKMGEQLYNATITGSVSGKHTDFEYKVAPVEGAQFEVYAAEDIYSQQIDSNLLGNYDADKYLVWEKGSLVGTITTDRNGFAYLSDLYLGKYTVKEVVAGPGFVLNRYEDDFEITAAESTKSLIVYDSIYENRRQKVKVSVTKKDAETKQPIAGAVFALIAKNDIVSGIRRNTNGIKNQNGFCFDYLPGDSRKLIAAGTIVDCAVSGKDGIAVFDADLPLGEYYVRELTAPAGYKLSNETRLINATYQGQNIDTINLSCEIQDEPIVVSITKYDLAGKKELPGAHLEVVGQDGKVVDSWISGNDSHYVRHLEIGKTYILRETKPADGYVTAEEIEFTVVDMSKLDTTDGIKIQEVKMYDDVTKVQISKKDFTTKDELPGAKLQIWTTDEGGNKSKLVEEWVSEDKPHYIEKLPIGDYVLVEESAPEGYLVAEEVPFTVKDSGEVQLVEMLDDYTKVKISKKDFTTKDELPGAKLQIWTADENGNKINMIEEWISEKEPHYIEKMPTGKYVLVEESAPDGYLVAEEVRFEIKATGEVQYVEMLDMREDPGKPEGGPTPTPSPTSTPEPSPTPGPGPNVPVTGDDSNMALWSVVAILAITVFSGCIIYLVVKRRKKDNSEA